MHLDVIEQTNKVNEGKKRNLMEFKTDLAGMLRKRQHDVGRYEAMKYFMQDDVKRLSWVAPLFNDGNVDSYEGKGDAVENSCHLGEGERVRM